MDFNGLSIFIIEFIYAPWCVEILLLCSWEVNDAELTWGTRTRGAEDVCAGIQYRGMIEVNYTEIYILFMYMFDPGTSQWKS